MLERVAAFDGDSTMTRILLSAGDFFAGVFFDDDDLVPGVWFFADGDLVPGFVVFADGDLVPGFEVFADGDFPAVFDFRAGVFFCGDDKFASDVFSSGSGSNTALTLFAIAFFLASSVFGEAAFLTGEIVITPICIF